MIAAAIRCSIEGMLLAEQVQPFADSQSQVCGPFGITNIAEVPEAYGTIPGVYGPMGDWIQDIVNAGNSSTGGITTEAAQAHAVTIAAIAKANVKLDDKKLAEMLVLATMNLMLASPDAEKQVLNLLPVHGVKQSVVTLAMASVPPVDAGVPTTTTTTPTTPTTTPTVTPTVTPTRIETAKKNIQTISKATGIGKIPIYKKWWFWLGIAVVATGTIYFYTRKPSV